MNNNIYNIFLIIFGITVVVILIASVIYSPSQEDILTYYQEDNIKWDDCKEKSNFPMISNTSGWKIPNGAKIHRIDEPDLSILEYRWHVTMDSEIKYSITCNKNRKTRIEKAILITYY